MSEKISRKRSKDEINRTPIYELPSQHLAEYIRRITDLEPSSLEKMFLGDGVVEDIASMIRQLLTVWPLYRIQSILHRMNIETQVLDSVDLVASYYRRKGISPPAGCHRILIWYLRDDSYSTIL